VESKGLKKYCRLIGTASCFLNQSQKKREPFLQKFLPKKLNSAAFDRSIIKPVENQKRVLKRRKYYRVLIKHIN
jgi:hypothetical protein